MKKNYYENNYDNDYENEMTFSDECQSEFDIELNDWYNGKEVL